MENSIDNLLENIFNGVGTQINILAGALLVIVGIIIFITSKKQQSKRKNIVAWVCIGIGCVAVLSGIVQVMSI